MGWELVAFEADQLAFRGVGLVSASVYGALVTLDGVLVKNRSIHS